MDFYCHKARLIIEVDGPIHNHPENQANDKLKDDFIKANGCQILRITNVEVLCNLNVVLDRIYESLKPTNNKGKLETRQRDDN